MAYVYEPFLYVLEYARLDFIAQVVEQPDTGVNGKHILEYESALIQVFPERTLDLFCFMFYLLFHTLKNYVTFYIGIPYEKYAKWSFTNRIFR